jgi:hypothetical protein
MEKNRHTRPLLFVSVGPRGLVITANSVLAIIAAVVIVALLM